MDEHDGAADDDSNRLVWLASGIGWAVALAGIVWYGSDASDAASVVVLAGGLLALAAAVGGLTGRGGARRGFAGSPRLAAVISALLVALSAARLLDIG